MANTSLNNWQTLKLDDLVYAYRKAKADCFFERSIFVSEQFVAYEKDLATNLAALLAELRSGKITELMLNNIGNPQLAPKKLSILETKQPRREASNTHCFFSDPERAFEQMTTAYSVQPEFRLVGDFPVIMHVLSALWINLIGHKFDAILPESSYGSRLRRYRTHLASDAFSASAKYHIDSLGSFEPYFVPYKKWRSRGLAAMRRELEADRAVIAATFDFSSYYHRIDPNFIKSHEFLDAAGIDLSSTEHAFTSALALAIDTWSSKAQSLIERRSLDERPLETGGVPIGLSAVRIIANALLGGLDRDIERNLSPIYYGRYVDDIFLVIRDPGDITNATQLIEYIGRRTTAFRLQLENNEIKVELDPSYAARTRLILQKTKQKIFFLKGKSGTDFLDNIESEIRNVSSERRLMPSLDHLESMSSARVLSASSDPSNEADTLRKADGLSVRKLGWSIQLRAIETFARDLAEGDWKDHRRRFYEFAHSHVIRPDRVLDFLDYIPRLLELAVSLDDWSEAKKIWDGTIRSIKILENKTSASTVRINGVTTKNDQLIWDELIKTTEQRGREAVARSISWDPKNGGPRLLSQTALDLCEVVGLGTNPDYILGLAQAFREADLAKVPYKTYRRREPRSGRVEREDEKELLDCFSFIDDLRDFLVNSGQEQGVPSGEGERRLSLLPFVFPTRPYTPQEISLFAKQCVFVTPNNDEHPTDRWARYIRAVRGAWVRKSEQPPSRTANSGEPKKPATVDLDPNARRKEVRLGIPSLLTSNQSWSAAASGAPELSPARYERIGSVVNQAIQAKPKPTHLILPELSLPERWVQTVSESLQNSGIDLIAGLDYETHDSNGISSSAVLVLTDNRLGFPTAVQIRQPKALPAPKEDMDLLRVHGRNWYAPNNDKPVYIQGGACFGVLVCSELQNVSHRTHFQGEIDYLLVLSWNQDLETFSALVESASLDIHAYIALVNNRQFGDSRVRAPAKEPYRRDICRIRGGENEHIVIAGLDIVSLRQFQSRSKNWPSADDPFKPVPEGFKISNRRLAIPK